MDFKKLLKKYDMSQARLSRILGYSANEINNWARNKATPPLGRIKMIAEAIGCTEREVLEALGMVKW